MSSVLYLLSIIIKMHQSRENFLRVSPLSSAGKSDRLTVQATPEES